MMAVTDKVEKEEKAEKEFKFPVEHFQAYIAKGAVPEGGALSKDQVNYLLFEYYENGYKLLDTHFVGQNEFGLGVLYVLVLDD